MPIVIEAVGGGLGRAASQMFHELAKIKSTTSGEPRNTTLTHFYMNLGTILHRENAKAILRRHAVFVDTAPLLNAATEARSTS